MNAKEINHEALEMKARKASDIELLFMRDDAYEAWTALPYGANARFYRWEHCYACNEVAKRGIGSADGTTN